MEFLDLELTMTGSMESKSDFKMLVAHFNYMLLLIFKLMTISLKKIECRQSFLTELYDTSDLVFVCLI